MTKIINKENFKVTIHIPDEIDKRQKQEKVNQIYDILKSERKSA